jgi:hypothetical protein
MEKALALPTGRRGRGVLSQLLLEDGHEMIVVPVDVYKTRHVQYHLDFIILRMSVVTSMKKEHKGEVRSEIPGGPFQRDSTLGWLVWHQMSDAIMYNINFLQALLQEIILITKIQM